MGFCMVSVDVVCRFLKSHSITLHKVMDNATLYHTEMESKYTHALPPIDPIALFQIQPDQNSCFYLSHIYAFSL